MRVERQTDRHADRNTLHSYQEQSNNPVQRPTVDKSRSKMKQTQITNL